AFTTISPARPPGTPGRPIVPTPTVPARSTFWAVREIVPPGGPIVSPGPARPTASTCAPASRVNRPATTRPRAAWRTQGPGARPASATQVVPGAAEQLPTKIACRAPRTRTLGFVNVSWAPTPSTGEPTITHVSAVDCVGSQRESARSARATVETSTPNPA